MVWLLAGVIVVTACGSSSDDGDAMGKDAGPADSMTSLQPAQSCERYLSCVLVAAPQSYAAQLTLYGSGSECWKTPQQTMNCGKACDAAFMDIANLCECVGTQCMAQTPSVDCTDTFEPNDDRQSAKPISGTARGAICPMTDVDMFSVSFGGGGTLGASATPVSSNSIALSILNAGGTEIANGMLESVGVVV